MTITVTPRRVAVLLITVLAFAVAYLLGSAHRGGSAAAAAETTPLTASNASAGSPGGTGITVSGTGKVTGTPDTLRLSLTVTANGSTVTAALNSANATQARVQKSLQGKGVEAKDLQTSGLTVSPNYTYTDKGQPVPHGYQVTESLAVVLRHLDTAGNAINTAVAAGGNAVRVDGISLDLEDTGALVTSARGSAFAAAKAKAEQYAKAAGRGLGSVVSVSEAVQDPTPVQDSRFAVAAAAAPQAFPVQAGSQDVSVTVTVVFAFA
jgi:uncharacterized protein